MNDDWKNYINNLVKWIDGQRAEITDTAAFLDQMAERIEGLIQRPDPHGWRTEPTGPFILAAADCRAMAEKLRK